MCCIPAMAAAEPGRLPPPHSAAAMAEANLTAKGTASGLVRDIKCDLLMVPTSVSSWDLGVPFSMTSCRLAAGALCAQPMLACRSRACAMFTLRFTTCVFPHCHRLPGSWIWTPRSGRWRASTGCSTAHMTTARCPTWVRATTSMLLRFICHAAAAASAAAAAAAAAAMPSHVFGWRA